MITPFNKIRDTISLIVGIIGMSILFGFALICLSSVQELRKRRLKQNGSNIFLVFFGFLIWIILSIYNWFGGKQLEPM